MIRIRKASDRGHANYGWLDTYHTFSFADYRDADHHSFRTLRVMNEDVVAPGQGFGTHPHRDMEIVTYVLAGALEHKDSMGNGEVLNTVHQPDGFSLKFGGRPGSVQFLYASMTDAPSVNAWVNFGLGGNFSQLFFGGSFTIPSKGWTELAIPPSAIGDPGFFGQFWYAQTFALDLPAPLPMSNVQSIFLQR